MSPALFKYVGPESIRRAVAAAPVGRAITSPDALSAWLTEHPEALSEGATYVVDRTGTLRLAPRRSEHVACAGGEEVRAAGEMTFAKRGDRLSIATVTNQSTGYCPAETCWPAVAEALERAGLPALPGFSQTFVFRRCPKCRQTNVVKEGWFVCAMCEADLPAEWNY